MCDTEAFRKSKHCQQSVRATMGIPILPQVPPGPSRDDPTCERSFPCTRMWTQMSSRRATSESILSFGHKNVHKSGSCTRLLLLRLGGSYKANRNPLPPEVITASSCCKMSRGRCSWGGKMFFFSE